MVQWIKQHVHGNALQRRRQRIEKDSPEAVKTKRSERAYLEQSTPCVAPAPKGRHKTCECIARERLFSHGS
eukprot:6102886-Pleurochrysis_carterae.AAC.1